MRGDTPRACWERLCFTGDIELPGKWEFKERVRGKPERDLYFDY